MNIFPRVPGKEVYRFQVDVHKLVEQGGGANSYDTKQPTRKRNEVPGRDFRYGQEVLHVFLLRAQCVHSINCFNNSEACGAAPCRAADGWVEEISEDGPAERPPPFTPFLISRGKEIKETPFLARKGRDKYATHSKFFERKVWKAKAPPPV